MLVALDLVHHASAHLYISELETILGESGGPHGVAEKDTHCEMFK